MLANDLEPEVIINGHDTGWDSPQQPAVPHFEQPTVPVLPAEPMPQKGTQLAFTRIEPPNLGQVWSWVRKGLDIVLERNLGQASWTPAHVRNAVMNNQASLYVCTEDTKRVAFAVVTIQHDPFLLVPTVLHVWAEYSEANDWHVANYCHQQIIALGKTLCLDYIEMASTRAAWARRLQSIGMKPVLTIYRLDLKET